MTYSEQLNSEVSQFTVNYTNCTEAFTDQMFMVLDGEASTDEVEKWSRHIETCKGCSDQFELEKSIKIKLTTEVTRLKASEDFIQSIFKIKDKA